jgi:hypothetical protein
MQFWSLRSALMKKKELKINGSHWPAIETLEISRQLALYKFDKAVQNRLLKFN